MVCIGVTVPLRVSWFPRPLTCVDRLESRCKVGRLHLWGVGIVVEGATDRRQTGFAAECCHIRTCKLVRLLCNLLQVDRLCQREVSCVDFEDFPSRTEVRNIHVNMTVESAGTKQCLVNHIRTICGGDDNNILQWLNAVEFGQQLCDDSIIAGVIIVCPSLARNGVEFKRGLYNGTRSLDTKRFRVVGVRNEDADDYHLYITNLPREEFLPSDLVTLYRCRWEVELLFRELKTQYELDEFDTSDPAVVEILVYAALLSLLVSCDLLGLVTEVTDDEIVFSPERWAATFRSHAQVILSKLGEFLGYSPQPLLERLIEDAQKIHQQRPILREMLATVYISP